MKKILMLASIMVMTTGLGACGFALRGSTQPTQLSPAHANVTIKLPDDRTALGLKQPLIKQLQSLAIIHQADSTNSIRIDRVQLRRYQLVGTLTEVRLVLSATVSYTIGDDISSIPMQVEQSYQYNEASVATVDQQGEKTKTWLYDHLAQRIAEQYYAKAKSP
ncbi:LPS-assembly lipoprotein LptE [Moraxella oculi]|uniref:LPS-assembly lipoprotein LptE n=1 Tax=Moraxella oculi TaxID=2940516 RepID=A0ABW8UBR5_9GAMM